MRKVMVTGMTIVVASTMRATTSPRPGYGASSCLRKFRGHAREPGYSGPVCAAVATLSVPVW